MEEIDALVAQGYGVKLSHKRRAKPRVYADSVFIFKPLLTVYELRRLGFESDPKGGRTVVTIRTPNGEVLQEHVRVSDRDHYNKKTGARIGLERLQQRLSYAPEHDSLSAH